MSEQREDFDGEAAPFHGGKRPDGVDFRMFALFLNRHHTYTMRVVIAARQDPQFKVWYDRMNLLCAIKKL